MLSQVSICHSGWGSPHDHYPWSIGPHCTRPPRHQTWYLLTPVHQTWDPPPPRTSDLEPSMAPAQPPQLVTPGGHHWRPVQTCSFEDPPGATSNGCRWSMYISKRTVGILLECFLVSLLWTIAFSKRWCLKIMCNIQFFHNDLFG